MEVTTEDIWVMLLSTIRYSMGRMTYMPYLCTQLYAKYAKCLTKEQRMQIGREIRQEVDLAEKIRIDKTLGAKCDHEMWQQFAAAIEAVEGPL